MCARLAQPYCNGSWTRPHFEKTLKELRPLFQTSADRCSHVRNIKIDSSTVKISLISVFRLIGLRVAWRVLLATSLNACSKGGCIWRTREPSSCCYQNFHKAASISASPKCCFSMNAFPAWLASRRLSAREDLLGQDFVEQPERSEHQLNAMVQERSNYVRNAISRGSFAEAVSKALEDPPAGRDPQTSKDKNLLVVMEALAAPRPADIPAVVKQLPPFQLDVLMKFVYRGMAFPELYNSSVLLAWHEKVTEVTGLGSIVRVMSDRLTV